MCTWIFLVHQESTTYNVLGILAVISCTIFVENNFLANLKVHTFVRFSIKKIVLKEWITFTKLTKQNVVCTHELSWFTPLCFMHHIACSLFSGSPVKLQKCTYNPYIALTQCFKTELQFLSSLKRHQKPSLS